MYSYYQYCNSRFRVNETENKNKSNYRCTWIMHLTILWPYHVLHIFDQTCIVLKLGWRSTTGPHDQWRPRLTPRRQRRADDKPSPRCPSLPSLRSFGAACVKLCGFPRPSLDITSVAAVSTSLQRRRYKFGLRWITLNRQTYFRTWCMRSHRIL